jgi:hypothetical protein
MGESWTVEAALPPPSRDRLRFDPGEVVTDALTPPLYPNALSASVASLLRCFASPTNTAISTLGEDGAYSCILVFLYSRSRAVVQSPGVAAKQALSNLPAVRPLGRPVRFPRGPRPA